MIIRTRSLLLLLAAMAVVLFVAACSETSEENEYDNWKVRNYTYIDSIARVARLNADGRWRIYQSYKLDTTYKNGTLADSVYCHVETTGSGTQSPLFSDTVRVNYRGRLIATTNYPQGYVFDQSYSGSLNPAIDVPSKLYLGGCVTGWITAMQQMVDGDIWTLYIPWELGYGTYDQNYIPAYSVLRFEVNLVKFYPAGQIVPDWN